MRRLAGIFVSLLVASGASPAWRHAIPSQSLKLAAQVHVEHGYFGITLGEIDADRAKALRLNENTGVEITNIQNGSPAQQAGLRTGDVLLTYNGEKIVGRQQLARLVGETAPGHKVKVQYSRAGKKGTTAVTAASLETQNFGQPTSPIGVLIPTVVVSEFPTAMIIWKTPLLGLECEPLGAQLADYFGLKHGVLIRAVDQGSAAEKAGIKAGDVLVGIGDRLVMGPRDITSFFRSRYQQGQSFSVTLIRRGKGLTFSIGELGGPE